MTHLALVASLARFAKGLVFAARIQRLTALVLIYAMLAPLSITARPLSSVSAPTIGEKATNSPEPTSSPRVSSQDTVQQRSAVQRDNHGMPRFNPPTLFAPAQPLAKADREVKVASLQIKPEGDIVLQVEQPVELSAIPVDSGGNAIQGLVAEWESSNEGVVKVTQDGHAVAVNVGTTQLTASAGNMRKVLKVTVVAGAGKFGGTKRDSVRAVSSIRKDSKETNLAARLITTPQKGSARRAHFTSSPPAPLPLRPANEDPLPDGETGSLYQPGNTVGSPPGRTTPGAPTPPAAFDGTEMPGSNDFTLDVPVISLPGRGIDVSLALVYNSLLWNKSTDTNSNTELTYDVDTGWPAPGWRLGYGQMESQGSQGFTLTDPSGTRHQLVKTDPSNSTDYNYDSTDGTFIHFYGGLTGGTVTYTDGTRVGYGATGNGGQPSGPRSYPVKITDRSGNYITIAYVNNQGPQISSIQDTLGRYIQFNYSSGDLVSITAPAYASQSDREAIRFYYEDMTVSTSFQGFCSTCIHGGGTTHVLRYVYVPGDTANTGTGYRYDYSAYGMIYQISQRREMTINSTTKALTSYGSEAALTTYNYPTTASSLTDVPAYTTRTDDWAGRTSNQSVYTFSNNAAQGTTSVTAPDGTITETKTYIDTGSVPAWKIGMMKEMTVKTSNNTVLAHTFMDWEDDGTGNNPRLIKVEVTNEANETKATTYDYTNMSYNNVGKVTEYDFATAGTLGTELRRTEMTYETGTNWTSRRLVHLPKIVKVYDGQTVIVRTDYSYDGENLVSLSGTATMQDQSYNPSSGSFNSATLYRGQVTSVTSYADAAAVTGGLTNTMKYDIVGNVTEETVSCCRKKTFTYSSDYNYAYPTSMTRGDTGQMSSSAAYDFNTGLIRTSTDENSQTSTVHYFAQTLRYYMTVSPDGGYSAIDYDDRLFADPDSSHMHSLTMQTVGTSIGSPGTAMHTYNFYDGRGATVRHYEDYTAADSGNATTDIEYDEMGRVKRVGTPYYATNGLSSSINPSGLWTTNSYDELGRVKQVTLTDGTTVQTTYAGTITTVTDQAGKQRRQKLDALGRVVRVDEPDANGSLGTVSSPTQPTTYEYDKLDNLIHIQQAGPNSNTQHRYFKYDSLSRLTYERQVEMAAPYSTTDYVAGNNLWSKKVEYDSQGLVTDAYDARQVHTHISYDGLNRVTGITYTGETSPTQTPAVTYTYDQAHTGFYNIDRLTSVSTASTSNAPATIQAYDYDIMGRVKSHSQTVGSNVYSTSYSYNVAGWLTSETYPSGKVVSYSYDEDARLSTVKDTTNQQSPKNYISSLSYAAHGGMSSATLGNGAIEDIGYNNRLQPASITLTKSSTVLQKYEYKYGQVNQSDGTVDETKNNGQIARIEGYIGSTRQWQQRFSYDAIGRLSTAGEYRGDTSALTYQANYSYDRWGNRYQKQAENSQSLSYVAVEDTDITKSTNQLASNTTYDYAGNVTADGKFRGLQYHYDANGRMWWSANTDNTGEATAVYDALGQRVQTTFNGNTKTLVYDVFGRMVAEYDSQAQSGTGGVKYLMADLQGSARVVTDGSGAVVARHDYQPFGGEVGATIGLRTTGQKYDVSDSTRQKYALTERDATGLDHTDWRKYDNSAGRWTSPDPYNGSMAVDDPQSFNRYSYTQNDPVNFVDPSGLAWIVPDATTGWGLYSWGFWGAGNLMDPVRRPGLDDILDDESDLHPHTQDGRYRRDRVPFNSFFDFYDSFGGFYPDSFLEAIENTFDRVKKILQGNSPCAQFFGPNALDALEAMRKQISLGKNWVPGGLDTGISQSFAAGVNAIPSGPFRTPLTFIVYLNGPFFMQGKGKIAGYNPGTEQAQTAALLHELAHNIKNAAGNGFLIPNDGPGTKAGLSPKNTELIRKKCSEEIFKGH
jgi:RHS repeat-associated protein